MITSFRSRALKRLFEDGDARGVPPQLAAKIILVLDALDAATSVEDLDQSGFGLHGLTGNRQGQWAIIISRNWRVTFEPYIKQTETEEEFHVRLVNYEDYH